MFACRPVAAFRSARDALHTGPSTAMNHHGRQLIKCGGARAPVHKNPSFQPRRRCKSSQYLDTSIPQYRCGIAPCPDQKFIVFICTVKLAKPHWRANSLASSNPYQYMGIDRHGPISRWPCSSWTVWMSDISFSKWITKPCHKAGTLIGLAMPACATARFNACRNYSGRGSCRKTRLDCGPWARPITATCN